MISYIDSHRDRFGVEPICRILQVAPSTYQRQETATVGPPSPRPGVETRDREGPQGELLCLRGRKVWRQLHREGHRVARCTVERLMADLGLEGRRRGRKRRTTIPAVASTRPADLVDRRFVAPAPNRLWIADITYVATWSGFAYLAYVADVFSRRILGWRVANTLRADLALDALEQAIWTRQSEDLEGLVHHSDRGVQYLSIRYTERLAAEGAITSVGSRGDSYDNAMAESIIGLYKSELITMQGPWRSVEDVELATLTWVHWWNNRRLLEPIGDIPPVEYETNWQNTCHDQNGGAINQPEETLPGPTVKQGTQ